MKNWLEFSESFYITDVDDMDSYIAIDSKDCIEIRQNYYQCFQEQKYKNKFKKILFFFLNEGIAQTIRKILATRLQNAIALGQKAVVCQFSIENVKYIGIGRQICSGKFKKFHTRLIFKIRTPSLFTLKKLSFNKDTLLKILSYLPVDESPLSDGLPSRIVSQNPELEIANPKILKNFLWKPKTIIHKNPNSVFLYGFGGYPRSYAFRYFKNKINSVIDYNEDTSLSIRNSQKVSYFEDYRDSLLHYRNIEKPIGIISTYHSSHFEIAKALFNANPKGKILIEKPLVVKFSDALELIKLRKQGSWFEAGYNRRYIGWNCYIKELIQDIKNPKIITMSIKEVLIPPTHWYFWPNQGTRITGNLCHWIDLAYFWLKSKPCEISLLNSNNSVSLSILFEDSSLVNIISSDEGNNLRGVQERIEVRTEDTTVFIDDYRKMIIYEGGKALIKKKILRDKGHDSMYKEFLTSTKTQREPFYKNDDIFWVSYLTERASQMLINGGRFTKISITPNPSYEHFTIS